ncbi:uncharacterized protein [Pyrus communis]|uniref:uncharacterized protein n=1 Tax=Pyrus communis TaxID=23211 RepID=UPI0035C00F56
MGKNLRDKNPNNPSGNEHSSGCVWGLLHIMKYHHWHYVKKRQVHKRRRGNKHTVGVGILGSCTANTRMPEDTDAKIDESTAKGKTMQSIPAGIHSVKARIRARISGEISKKKGRHNRSSSYPVRSQLKQHHFEAPTNLHPIAEMVLNENSPTIVHHGNEKSCATSNLASPPATSYEGPISGNNDCCGDSFPPITRDRTVHDQVNENQRDHTFIEEKLDNDRMQDMFKKKLINLKELDADASSHHPKEYLEALDIINVNKELLVKILHDPGSPLAAHFNNQQAVSAKMGLTRSDSFPVKLKHKHELTGSLLKEESKSKNISKTKKLVGSSSLKYAGEHSIPSISEHTADGILELNQTIADNSSSAKNLRSRGENQVSIKRFKDIRQKIKHVIKESRQERNMIAMDAILHKVPHGQKLAKEMEKEIINHSKDLAMNREGKDSSANSFDSEYSISTFKKKQQRHMRRASSLNASLDKYCEFYESSCNREAKCYTTSERLKLRNEGVGSPLRSVPKTLGRIFSLPEMKSYNYQSEESSDVFSSGAPIRVVVDDSASRRSISDEQNTLDFSIGSEYHMQLDAPVESEIKKLADVGEFNAASGNKMASTSVADSEKSAPVYSVVDDIENLTEPFPISVPEFNVSLSEGEETEIKPRDEQDNLAKLGHDFVIGTPKAVHIDTEKIESPRKHLRYDMTHLRVDDRDMAEFNYVRNVLKQSGFNGNESLGTWHSDDQPVDPLMYGDAEGCLVHGPDCSGNEEGKKCDHNLLFDMINEVLMEIYGRSYNYCPMALSSLCHIPLMPAGHHVLKEVWALVSWYLCLRPEVDQSLDYVVSRDLAKNDGWMNLQFDSECIGIELEDLIFDEILEEVLCV